MRYKDNALNKINQLDILVNRTTLEVNRNMGQDKVLESLSVLKEHLEGLREMISIEPDDFAQQFQQR